MALTYVRYFPRSVTTDDGLFDRQVLLFDPVSERQRIGIGDRFRRLDPAYRTAELVLIRGATHGFVSEIEQDPILRGLLRNTPVLLLLSGLASPTRLPELFSPAGFRVPESPPGMET